MSEKFNNCFKLYEKAIEGRNFHYSNYNTWVNYYSIFTSALFVCYYNCYKCKGFDSGLYSSIFMLLVSFLGMITAICWHSTVKGHYWWMLSWINIVQKYEGELNSCSEDIFDYWVYNAYKASSENFDRKNISSQKLTSAFTFIVSLAWGIILSYHTYSFFLCLQRKLGNINDFCMKVFIFIISALLVIFAFIFLLLLFSRGSDISSMKPDIKEGNTKRIASELVNTIERYFKKLKLRKIDKVYEKKIEYGLGQNNEKKYIGRFFDVPAGNLSIWVGYDPNPYYGFNISFSSGKKSKQNLANALQMYNYLEMTDKDGCPWFVINLINSTTNNYGNIPVGEQNNIQESMTKLSMNSELKIAEIIDIATSIIASVLNTLKL